MTPEQIKEIADGVSKWIPEMVETLVEEKSKDTVEKLDTVETDVKEIKESLADISKMAKFAGKTEKEADLELAKEYFGTYIKTLKRTKNQEAATKAAAEVGYKATMNEGTDWEGGFLVPEEFSKNVVQRLGKAGVARANCTVLPMATDTLLLNRVASGVTVGFIEEGAAYSSSEPTFARNKLVAKKVGAIISSTLELIDDNTSNETIWSIAITQVTNALLLFEDTQVFMGDGTGDNNFTGVTVASGTNLVTMATGKTAFSDITYQNILDMIYSIEEKDISSEGNLKFYGHRNILGICRGMKDESGRPILEYVGSGPGQSALILGYEFETTPVMPWTASEDVDTPFLVFWDLTSFILWDRQSITMDYGYKSGNWEKDIQSLKVRERIDGELIFPKSLSVLKTAAE